MKYYKLSMDMESKNDIICHYQDDYGIYLTDLKVGHYFENWNDKFEFIFSQEEGNIWTDYLANDKGWFLVSKRLKELLATVNTDIQYFKVNVREVNELEATQEYYVANILKVVDALCLEKSKYSAADIAGKGMIYNVSKYGIYADQTEDADVFKLANGHEIPVFASERFKKLVEKKKITGISFTEICVKEKSI